MKSYPAIIKLLLFTFLTVFAPTIGFAQENSNNQTSESEITQEEKLERLESENELYRGMIFQNPSRCRCSDSTEKVVDVIGVITKEESQVVEYRLHHCICGFIHFVLESSAANPSNNWHYCTDIKP